MGRCRHRGLAQKLRQPSDAGLRSARRPWCEGRPTPARLILEVDDASARVAIAHDEADEEVKRKIVEKYIKEKHQPGLWEDYGKGLLQVFDIAKLVVTPPHIPWDNDE